MNPAVIELMRYITRNSDAEKAQQMRLEEIDRLSSANVSQQRGIMEEERLQKRLGAQDQNEQLQTALFQRYLSSGMPEDQAMQAANRDINKILSADPLNAMTSAELERTRNEGRLPGAPATGAAQEMALRTGAEMDTSANRAGRALNETSLLYGPPARAAELRSNESGFNLANKTNMAQTPWAAPVTDATSQATVDTSINKSMELGAQRRHIPSLTDATSAEQEMSSKLNAAKAQVGLQTMPDPALLRQAQAAEIQAKMNQDRASTVPLSQLQQLKGVDMIMAPQFIRDNPELFRTSAPITPSALPARPGNTPGAFRKAGTLKRN
jgi:hypothetical protein